MEDKMPHDDVPQANIRGNFFIYFRHLHKMCEKTQCACVSFTHIAHL